MPALAVHEHRRVGRAVDPHAVLEIAHQHVGALGVAEVVRGRARGARGSTAVSFSRCAQTLSSAVRLESVRRPARALRCAAPRARGRGASRPALRGSFRRSTSFVSSHRRRGSTSFVSTARPPSLRDGEAPDDVRGHVVVAVAFLPPAPAAVVVLEVVEALHACGGHASSSPRSCLPFGCVVVGGARFDAAEHPAIDVCGSSADARAACARRSRRGGSGSSSARCSRTDSR